MAHRVLTKTAVSISEHKKNPMATVAAGEGMAVAVLNRNEPAFTCVPGRLPGADRSAEPPAMVALMRRGEIWGARLNPNQGADVGKLRPVVIVQADPITQAGLATVIVVPLTTQSRPAARALRMPIRSRDRLLCDSFAMADQPRSLDRSRLGDGPLTTLSPEELAELDQLRRENARLIGLLEAHGIAWRSSRPAPTGLAPFGEGDSEAAPAKGPSSKQEKVALFRRLSAAVTTSMPCAGRAAAAGARAMRRPAPMRGGQASARSHGSPAATATTGSCCPSAMRRSMAIWPASTPSASTPCWRTTTATCWPSTLTSRAGVTTPGAFCARVGSWRCRRRWRSPAPGKVLRQEQLHR